MAIDIAIHHGNLVGKLALGSTTPDAETAVPEIFDRWIALAKAGDSVGLYQEFGKAIYPSAIYEKYSGIFTAMAKSVTPEELARFVTLAEGTVGFNMTDRLAEIQCPVLALGAADDRVLGADSIRKIIDRLGGRPDFSCYIYDGFGHAAFDTAPDYRQRLYDFFID